MPQHSEEIARRKAVMAEAGRRADEMFAEIDKHRQTQLAEAIQKSITEAPPAVSVGDAINMLYEFESVKDG